MESRCVGLADGRRLGYDVVGDPAGAPLLFFHGLGGTRVMRHPDDGIAARAGVRLIAVDRPGIGASDPARGRTLRDWPADVLGLVDRLEIPRFALLGHSGGGPHAMAVAAALPDRVAALGLASSSVPLSGAHARRVVPPGWRLIGLLAARTPSLVRGAMLAQVALFRRSPRRAFVLVRRYLPEADRRILARPQVAGVLQRSIATLFAQGGGGIADDAAALGAPPGFRLEEIAAPTWVWHGTADNVLPLRYARYLGRTIPGAELRIFPGEGHFTYLEHWEEMLRTLAGAVE